MQAAQASHAAFAFSVRHPGLTADWHQQSNFLVLLAAADEPELLALQAKAEAAGLEYVAVEEPDLPGNPLTALAIAPSDAARRLVSNLPLALRQEVMAA